MRKEVEPVAGRTLVTTLDPEIQAAAQETMNELVKKYKPNFATAIVMRPQTGEIVAMVTAPSYDLNKRPKNVVELATNRCTQFAYEPGSLSKSSPHLLQLKMFPTGKAILSTVTEFSKLGIT